MGSVIFDLDGTLADTSGDLIAAANHCFRDMDMGDVLCMVGDKSIAFRGGRAMLTEGLTRSGAYDPAVVERYYPILLESYGGAIDVHTTMYPGAMDAVAALHDAGHGIGICTNKPEALARLLLDRLGISDGFGAFIGADTLPVRKPDPEPLLESIRRVGGTPTTACLIGDTVTDRETARAASVVSVLVTFGPTGSAVADLRPEALLHDFVDLPGMVKGFWQGRVA